MSVGHIELRGVRVHNLKSIDLDIPRENLVVFCGVSGSGKTSLALDTLYAEGQRRYIESFSVYARQFLERLDKPAADRIDGIPPAVSVTHKNSVYSSRTTIGTLTEISDYLRILYAKIGRVICQGCGQHVQRDSPESVAERLFSLPDQHRFLVSFPAQVDSGNGAADAFSPFLEDGFVRAIVGNRIVQLADAPRDATPTSLDGEVHVVVDRLAGGSDLQRVRDSLETAFRAGEGRCSVFLDGTADPANRTSIPNGETRGRRVKEISIDGKDWRQLSYSADLRCSECDRQYPQPEPRLYSFNSPLGACPQCEGFGNVMDMDVERVVPDPGKSIRDGAIAPWNTPAHERELSQLLSLAGDYGIPVDVPFRDLTDDHLRVIQNGVPDHGFGGLNGFFERLERKKYKMHVRVFLSRWRSYRNCPSCLGTRLRPDALATYVGGKNIAEVSQTKIHDVLAEFGSLELNEWQHVVGGELVRQVTSRLEYLVAVGLGYLTLDRTLRTLSGGEAQRVALTSALGSNLVNMLYVLDEPSAGLHAQDVGRLLSAVTGLRDHGNTVVLVEHEETLLRAADRIIEVGPGAGESGGRVTFEGTVEEMLTSGQSLTGDYMAGKRGVAITERRREASHGWIRLKGASGNNLKHVQVDFPLGILCLVCGVSGSGKSTLVQDTLYPALCLRKRKDAPKPCPFEDVLGDGQLDDVILIDQSPIGRSPRSNPITYVKAFDSIRTVFAETIQARTRNYSASYFSFNVDGGRCDHCKGDGYVEVDMQFLANVYMKCSQCDGSRYRREILDVTYRGKNIAQVLQMSVREAFSFFRGQPRVQAKLKQLIDVGLEYLRLGQPANTLSSGEAQRLKLAGHLNAKKRGHTLFVLDEPTTGLHASDIVQLLDCFDALLSIGHSLIVVEHNLQLMKSADYIIDVGPEAAEGGGQVVVCGTPEQVASHGSSITGRFLAKALAASASS